MASPTPFLLLTSSHGNPNPSNQRPGCPTQLVNDYDGLEVRMDVDFAGGRTAQKALDDLQDIPANQARRQYFRQKKLVFIFLGGNDLCPGKVGATDPEVGKETARTLIKLYHLLSDELKINRVLLSTLIPRPKFKEAHEKVIAKANETICQDMGKNGRSGDVFRLHTYYRQHKGNLSEVFWRDNIHMNEAGIELFTSRIVRRAWAIVKATPALQQ